MSETFEELIAREIDPLWEAALFLSGGEPLAAEECLLAGVRSAFRDFHVEERAGEFARWVEGRLVRTFVERSTTLENPADPRPAVRIADGGSAELTRARLNQLAGELAPGPRAAIWLVVLKRWSYEDAEGTLGVDRDTLVDLLRRGRRLMSRLVAGAEGARRARGGSGA